MFSELLKEAIREADALFDYPGKQFTLFKDLEAQVSSRSTPGVPDRFADHPMAQSFFGAFIDAIGSEELEGITEDQLVAEAHHVEAAVENAIQTYSINPGSIEAEIRRALLPRYFKFFGGLVRANDLIERVISIVRAGHSRGRS